MLEDKITELKKSLLAMQLLQNDLTEQLKHYERMAKRPEDTPHFIKWVEDNLQDDLVLLPRARESLKKAKNLDIEMVCDAMPWKCWPRIIKPGD